MADVGVIKSAQNFFASKGYDVISLVFMVVCLANSLYSNNGVFKFVSVVIPALSGMAQITGAASQSQSGEDIDMETLGYEREAVMYSDDIDVVDPETGKPTGEKTTSSFWSNPKSLCNPRHNRLSSRKRTEHAVSFKNSV